MISRQDWCLDHCRPILVCGADGADGASPARLPQPKYAPPLGAEQVTTETTRPRVGAGLALPTPPAATPAAISEVRWLHLVGRGKPPTRRPTAHVSGEGASGSPKRKIALAYTEVARTGQMSGRKPKGISLDGRYLPETGAPSISAGCRPWFICSSIRAAVNGEPGLRIGTFPAATQLPVGGLRPGAEGSSAAAGRTRHRAPPWREVSWRSRTAKGPPSAMRFLELGLQVIALSPFGGCWIASEAGRAVGRRR
jgi:hypothetical protein